MIPVEKKSITRIDRKNMLKRYSKIPLNIGSFVPMNSKPPRNSAKRPSQKMMLQIRIIESRSREPDRSEWIVFLVRAHRSPRRAQRRLVGRDRRECQWGRLGDSKTHEFDPAGWDWESGRAP